MHRGLLSRVFTPKKMNTLEPQIREFCARSLDPLVGTGELDFVRDLGAQMPMRVIGMLLGIPEQDQEAIRDHSDAQLRTEPGKPMEISQDEFVTGEAFAEYVDWRADHPSDDLMTEMLRAEFEDETGTTRTLTREEVLTYVNVIAGAGNETTTRLIGWTGKVLADHPDQRRELVEDRSLIPDAIEELLRFEPPAPHVARYVACDVEHHGETVPEGSVMVFLIGSANRDDRRFPDGDRFDIHRPIGQPLTFGYGIHFCLGAALARLEGRVALDEVLQRFPEWDVDLDRARLSPTSTVRGWETLPVAHPVSDGIERFQISVDDSVLDDLRDRLARVRIPDEIEGAGWDYGIPFGYLRELVTYWRDIVRLAAAGGAAQRAGALPHPRRRPVDPLRPRPFVAARRPAPAPDARLAGLRGGVPRRHPAAHRAGGPWRARRGRVPRRRAVVAGLRVLGADTHARLGPDAHRPGVRRPDGAARVRAVRGAGRRLGRAGRDSHRRDRRASTARRSTSTCRSRTHRRSRSRSAIGTRPTWRPCSSSSARSRGTRSSRRPSRRRSAWR